MDRRILSLLYLLTLFLVGLGYLAIMPVFEGFDEYAHYSSMRQIADTGTIPVLGSSYIDQIYQDYKGPQPYTHDQPPFDSGMVYAKFFDHPDWVEQYKRLYREESFPTIFRPSQDLNWQAQHPPLYYILMAPLVKAVGGYSFVTQIFLLRLASFCFALAGIAFGIFAIERSGTLQEADQSRLGFLLYPIIFPMFFSEFTRIGNDAFCIFLVGVLAYLLSLWRRDEGRVKISLAIGITLGLGLLTKAFFLPIAVALAAFLTARLLQDKEEAIAWFHRRLSLISMFYPAFLIGGAGYLCNPAHFGVVGVGVDSILLAQQGGWILELKKHFSLYGLVRAIASMLRTSSWAGTWSLAELPLSFQVPLFGLMGLVIGAYARQLKYLQMTASAWLPVWLFAFFGAGLFYHVMVGLALNGEGQTPGWYVHILMPLTAPAIGLGCRLLLDNRRTRLVMVALLLYAAWFHVMALWGQFALFTGCATKADNTYYAFAGNSFCLDQMPVLISRLSILGFPVLAIIGFGGALGGILLLLRGWPPIHLEMAKSR